MKKQKQQSTSDKLKIEKWTVAKLTEVNTVRGGLHKIYGGLSGTKTCPIVEDLTP